MRAGDRPGIRSRAQGFTYLALLWWVAISGVMLAALGTQWKQEATRQREIELVFRGGQIQAALFAYQSNTPPGQPTLPASLADLLDDTRQGPPRRHLRRAWGDPITGKPWGLLLTESGRIRGVYSLSERKPLTAPESVNTYREWLFDVPDTPPLPAEGASSPDGATPPSTGVPPTGFNSSGTGMFGTGR